jgi:hypothetical protein
MTAAVTRLFGAKYALVSSANWPCSGMTIAAASAEPIR